MPTITADRFLLTTDDYRRMADAGILGPTDRVELIHGEVVPMSPIGASHLFCVNALNRLFAGHTGPSVEVSVQNPVQLGPHHEPEPDLALLRAADAPRVPQIWIINIPQGRLETHARPGGATYAERAVHTRGDTITLPHTDHAVRVAGVLP